MASKPGTPRPSTPRPSTPRLAPLPESECTDEQRELLDLAIEKGPGSAARNIYLTMARFPGLMRRAAPFGGKLNAGKIPARDRELVILRVAWLVCCRYEWGQHVVIGRASGMTDEEIRRVIDGPEAAGWDPFDAVVLRATDELHFDGCITDDTWAALTSRYDERQLIEFTMLVGAYHTFAFFLNSTGVQLEPGLEGFPSDV